MANACNVTIRYTLYMHARRGTIFLWRSQSTLRSLHQKSVRTLLRTRYTLRERERERERERGISAHVLSYSCTFCSRPRDYISRFVSLNARWTSATLTVAGEEQASATAGASGSVVKKRGVAAAKLWSIVVIAAGTDAREAKTDWQSASIKERQDNATKKEEGVSVDDLWKYSTTWYAQYSIPLTFSISL